MTGRGIAVRIALAALGAAIVGLAILAIGVIVVGGQTFADMMVDAGDTAQHAREMFDASVTQVVIVAALVALAASVALAVGLGRHLARPLANVAAAARRIAMGDYRARVPRQGPDELVGLADSFNQMAASLAEQERLRNDFIANAAHELRTPLTNLQGYLEALRDGVIDADQATYDSLWDEAERLVRLSRSLDALAEGDAATVQPRLVDIDLGAALLAAVELARPAAETAGLEIELSVPHGTRARANPDQLAQVVGNLLSNAVRYSLPGGRIEVWAEGRSSDVLVTVANPSDPIGAEDVGRLFERFYRVEKSRDRARGGAGIGLSIVRQLVEAAGGNVGAESSEGQTRIWFSLPVRPAPRG